MKFFPKKCAHWVPLAIAMSLEAGFIHPKDCFHPNLKHILVSSNCETFFPSIFPKWLFQCSSKNMYLLHDAKIFTNATPSFCSAPPHIFSQMLLFFYLCFPFFLTSTSNKAGSRQWFPVLTNIAITVGALPTINSWFSLLEILRGLGSRLDLMIFENIN